MTAKTESSLFKFFKNTIIYFAGTILSRIISFLLLPLYTSYINPEDYGYYDLSITYVTIVTFSLFFDIWVTTMRFMYEKNEDEWKWKVSQSGFTIFACSFLLLSVIGIIVYLFFDIQYLWLIICYALTITLTNMFLYIARGYKKNVEYTVSGVLNTFIYILSNILMIVILKMDFSSLYISSIFGHLIQLIYLEYKVRIVKNLFKTKVDFGFIKNMFLYSLPLSINSISYWLLTSFNKIIVQNVLSIEYNGYYAIGYKFGSALSLITNSFTLAWQDLSFSRSADDKSNGQYYSLACDKYLSFLGIGACILIPSFNILFDFFIHESYYPAKATIPMFIIVAILSSYSTFIGNIFYAIKDTKSIFYSMIVSSMVNLITCYPLIKILGINGANIAIAFSFIINILIRAKILNKRINFKLNNKGVIGYTILVIITSIVFSTDNIVINLVWLFFNIIIAFLTLRNDIKTLLYELKRKLRALK